MKTLGRSLGKTGKQRLRIRKCLLLQRHTNSTRLHAGMTAVINYKFQPLRRSPRPVLRGSPPWGYLPQQPIDLLLIFVLVHEVSGYFDVRYCVYGMPLEISVIHRWAHVQAFGPKMIGAGDIRYNALAALSLVRHSHPHVPIPEDIGGRPLCLELAFV